jgi:NitT/TauT family transport system substrate-binding protein
MPTSNDAGATVAGGQRNLAGRQVPSHTMPNGIGRVRRLVSNHKTAHSAARNSRDRPVAVRSKPAERTMMILFKRSVLASLILVGLTAGSLAQEASVRIGNAPSIASGATLIAIERGYFRDAGVKITIENLDSSANAIALLAQNQFQVVEGGISAGYFNALEKDLPITIAMSRVSTPLGHNLMLRSDLKDRISSIRQLKGRVVATNGPGSVSTYEIGKILETGGLTIADVDIKVIPFTQYSIAFANKAVDAALAINPFTTQLRNQGLALPFGETDDLVEPRPITISVNMINTDWAKKNPDLVRNFYVAALRGARDYCQAYHGGSTRKQIIDLLVRSGTESRPELLHDYAWPARDPNGRVSIDSMLDMQAWYAKNKYTGAQFPAERLVDRSHVEYAAQKLGPFVLENRDSTLPGCR